MKNIFKTIGLVFLSTVALSGCDDGIPRVRKEAYDNMYQHLTDCWNNSMTGMHFDNVFYGDSRVVGADFVKAYSDKSVVNFGVSGDRVKDLINRFKLIKTVTPKRVIMAIGGNNAIDNEYETENFRSEYKQLLTLFKDNNYEVIVNNIVGLTTAKCSLEKEKIDSSNLKIEDANKVIKSLTEEMNITYFDIASKMNKEGTNEMNPEYSADGVHFNSAGNEVWYNELRQFVI